MATCEAVTLILPGNSIGGKMRTDVMAKITCIAIAAVFVDGEAAAETGDLTAKIRACSALRDSLERLRCFDGIAQDVKLNPGRNEAETSDPSSESAPSNAAEGVFDGGWQVEESKSPIDDSPKVMLGRTSIEPYRNQFGGQELAFLGIRCVENKTDLVVSTDTMLGFREDVKVTVRIDDKPAQTQWSPISASYQAVFAPKPIALIKELLSAEKFIVRLHPSSSPDITAQFDLADLDKVITKVQAACGWE